MIPKTQRHEIRQLVIAEYQRLSQQQVGFVNGCMLWARAEKYVYAQLNADWIIFQSNYRIGAFK